jgi:hypothetical protein
VKRGWVLIILAVLGWAALALGFATDTRRTYFSYLTAYTWAITLALGALCFLAIVNAMNATWPVVVRRVAEGIAATLPAFAVLFAPIFVGMARLYPWLWPERFLDPHEHQAVTHRLAYYNVPFFVVRWLIVFACWIAFALLFRQWSLRQERGDGERLRRRICAAGVAALIPLALTLSAAAFDWLMSLTPTWYSTVFGIYFFAGSFVSGIATIVIVARWLQTRGLLPQLRTSHYHALGRLLLAFTAFWGYIAFFQYMLIWIANRPAEGAWFVQREVHAWRGISMALVLGQFVVPFLLLLSFRIKRSPTALALLALWIVAAHYIDATWLVMPSFASAGFRPSWIDAAALLSVAGSAALFGIRLSQGKASMPIGDPALAQAIEYESR